jgi:hypothetical protein
MTIEHVDAAAGAGSAVFLRLENNDFSSNYDNWTCLRRETYAPPGRPSNLQKNQKATTNGMVRLNAHPPNR